MHIFLVRHGDAGDRLTPLGQSQIARTAEFLKSLVADVSKTALLTSQLPRAVETAEIIKNTLGLSEMTPKSWLTCNTEENTETCLVQFVADHPELEVVVAVSHMPEIEQLLGRLGFYGTAHNGSVHEVEFQTRTVTHLFVP